MQHLIRFSLLTLTLLPLQAQSRYGLEIGNTFAQGELRTGLKEGKDGKVGATLGASLRVMAFKPGRSFLGEAGDVAIRLRFNAQAYRQHPKPNTGIDVTGTALNVEVVHTFGKDLTGFQVIGGVGTAHWERASALTTLTTQRPVATLGAGWQWSHVGVEARWTSSSFSAHQTANSFDTIFTVRF
jgi:hypothetical protein